MLAPAGAQAIGSGTSTPTTVTGLSGVVDLDAWLDQTCAVLGTGSVACWGELGVENTQEAAPVRRTAPYVVPGIGDATRVSGRCVVRADRTVSCWGSRFLGTFITTEDGPVPVAGLTDVVDISVGTRGTSCALRTDGTVWCWGNSRFGATGIPGDQASGYTQAPAAVPGVTGATSVSVGEQHACATLSSGALRCWGTAPRVTGTTPTDIGGLSGIAQVSAATQSTCVTSAAGAITCFGDNAWGEMGVVPDGLATGDKPVAGLPAMVQVSTALKHTCAVTATGEGRCWGLEADGRLGNPVYRGDGTSESPVPVLGLTGIASFVTGDDHTCALLTGGTVRCFGSDAKGQLGNGDAALPADPTPDTPGATIPAASSTPLATATPGPTPTPTPLSTPAPPQPQSARRGNVIVLTAFELQLRAGKSCPKTVTITLRRPSKKTPRTIKRIPTTLTGGKCVVTVAITLPSRLAKLPKVAMVVTGTGIVTRQRAFAAA